MKIVTFSSLLGYNRTLIPKLSKKNPTNNKKKKKNRGKYVTISYE